jgi:hypothetical protein
MAPRWYEPRFVGQVSRHGIAADFLDGLADRLRHTGLSVREPRRDPPAKASYRMSAAPPWSLHLTAPDATLGVALGHRNRLVLTPVFESDWDELRLWRDDARTLLYEGWFRGWASQQVPTWSAGICGSIIPLTFFFPTAVGLALSAIPVAVFAGVFASHRRRAQHGVEQFVESELKRAS